MIRPACLDRPDEIQVDGCPIDEYWPPTDGQELYVALGWMLENYGKVRCVWGYAGRGIYCHLQGFERKKV